MANNNKHTGPNVPALRFPEFSGEWIESKLGDIADFSKGAGISKDQRSEEGNPCILYGELYTRYKSEVITNVFSKTALPDSELVKSKANDIIIPASGETAEDIATARCVPFDNILLGGDLNIIRLHEQDGKFFSYQLNGVRKYDIATVAQGVSVVHLHAGDLKGITVKYPSHIAEQEKISQILGLIDDRIATQSKIIEEQETLLRSLRHKLFNQCVDSHTQCRIGDILSIGSGKDYQHLREGEIPVYGTGGLISHVNESLYDGESVCIGRKGTINKPLYLSGRFWTVDTLFYTHSFNGILPRFCYHLFCTIDWLTYNEASGVPSLSKSTIEKILVSIPQIDIQKRIVQILDSIEEKINIDRNTLLDYQKQKIYLLSRMFI